MSSSTHYCPPVHRVCTRRQRTNEPPTSASTRQDCHVPPPHPYHYHQQQRHQLAQQQQQGLRPAIFGSSSLCRDLSLSVNHSHQPDSPASQSHEGKSDLLQRIDMQRHIHPFDRSSPLRSFENHHDLYQTPVHSQHQGLSLPQIHHYPRRTSIRPSILTSVPRSDMPPIQRLRRSLLAPSVDADPHFDTINYRDISGRVISSDSDSDVSSVYSPTLPSVPEWELEVEEDVESGPELTHAVRPDVLVPWLSPPSSLLQEDVSGMNPHPQSRCNVHSTLRAFDADFDTHREQRQDQHQYHQQRSSCSSCISISPDHHITTSYSSPSPTNNVHAQSPPPPYSRTRRPYASSFLPLGLSLLSSEEPCCQYASLRRTTNIINFNKSNKLLTSQMVKTSGSDLLDDRKLFRMRDHAGLFDRISKIIRQQRRRKYTDVYSYGGKVSTTKTTKRSSATRISRPVCGINTHRPFRGWSSRSTYFRRRAATAAASASSQTKLSISFDEYLTLLQTPDPFQPQKIQRLYELQGLVDDQSRFPLSLSSLTSTHNPKAAESLSPSSTTIDKYLKELLYSDHKAEKSISQSSNALIVYTMTSIGGANPPPPPPPSHPPGPPGKVSDCKGVEKGKRRKQIHDDDNDDEIADATERGNCCAVRDRIPQWGLTDAQQLFLGQWAQEAQGRAIQQTLLQPEPQQQHQEPQQEQPQSQQAVSNRDLREMLPEGSLEDKMKFIRQRRLNGVRRSVASAAGLPTSTPQTSHPASLPMLVFVQQELSSITTDELVSTTEDESMSTAGNDGSVSAPVGSSTSSASLARLPRFKESGASGGGEGGGGGGDNVKIGRNTKLTHDRIHLVPNRAESDSYLRAFNPTLDPSTSTLPPSFNPGSMTAIPFYNGQGPVVSSPPVYTSDSFNFGSTSAIRVPFGQDVRSSSPSPSSASDSRRASSPATNSDGSPNPFIFGASVAGSAAESSPSSASRRASFPASMHIPFNFTPSTNSIPFNFTANTGSTASSFQRPPSSGASASSPATPFIFIPSTLMRFAAASGPAISFGIGGPIESSSTPSSPFAPTTFPVVSGDELLSATPFNYAEVFCSSPSQENDKTDAVDSATATTGSGVAVDQSASTAASGSAVPINNLVSVSAIPFVAVTPLGPGPSTSDVISSAAQPVTLETEDTTKAATCNNTTAPPSGLANGPTVSDGGASPSLIDLDFTSLTFSDIPPEQPTSSGTGDVALSSSTVFNSPPVSSPTVSDGGTLLSSTSFASSTGSDISGGQPVAFEAGVTIGGLSSVSSSSRHTNITSSSQKFPNRPSAYKSANAGANHVNSRYATGPAKMVPTQKPVRKPPSLHSRLLGSQDSDDDESSSSYSDDGNGDQSAPEPPSTPNLLGSYAILPVSSSALPPVTAPKPPSPINPPTTTQQSPSVTPSALSNVASRTTASGSSQSPGPPATTDILDNLLAAITSQGLAIREVESSALPAAPTSHRALPHAVLSNASMLTQTASSSSSTEIPGIGAPTAILTHLSLLTQAAAISLPVSPTSSGAPASVSAGLNLMFQSVDTCQSVSTSNVALADGIEGSASPSSGGGLLSEGGGEGLSSESEAPGQPGGSPGSSGSDSDSDSDSESNPPSNSGSPTSTHTNSSLNPYEALVEAMMNWSVSCTSAASPVSSGFPRRVSSVVSIFNPQRELVSHYSYTAASLSSPPSYLQLGSVQPLPSASGSPDTLSEPLVTNAPQIGNLAVLGTSAPATTLLVPSSTELASLSASSQPTTSGAGGGNSDNMQPIPELTFVNQVTPGASITPISATVTTLVSTAYDASASTSAAAAGLSSSNPLSQMTIASSTGHSAQGVIAPILSASSGSSGVPASAGSSASSGSTTTATTTTTAATSTSATTTPIISAIAAVITPITTISVSTAGPGHAGARQPGGGIAPVGASASSSSTGQSSSTAPSINLRRHARDGESDMDIDDDNRHQNKRPLISSGSVATTPATTAVPSTASVYVSSAAPASTSGSSRPWWVTLVPGSGIRVNQPPVVPAPVPLVPPIWSSSSSGSLSSSSQQQMSTQSLSLFPQQTQQTQSPPAQPAQSTHSACMQQMQQVHSGFIQQNQPIQSAFAQQNPLVQSMQHPMQSTFIQNTPSTHSSPMPPIPFGQPLSTMQYIGPRIPTYPPPLAVQSSLRAAGYSAFLGSTTPELARPLVPSQASTWFAPAQVSAWSAPVQASTWSAPKSPPPFGPVGPRPPPLLAAPVPPSLPVSPVPPPLPIVPAPLPTPVVSILPPLPVAPLPVPPPLPVVPLPPPLPVAPALPPGYVPSRSLPLLYSNLFPSNPPVLQPLQPSQPSQPPWVAAPIIASNMFHLHPPPPPPPPQLPTAVAPIKHLPTVRLSAFIPSFASFSFSPLPSLYGMPQPTSSSQLNPPPPLQSIPQPTAPPQTPGTFYRSVRPRLSGPSASLPPIQQQHRYPSAIIPHMSSWPVRPVPLVSTTMPHQPSVPAPPLSLGSYISLPRAGQSGATLAPLLKHQQAASSAVHMGPLFTQQKQVCSSGARMLPISTQQQTSLFSSSMASAFSQPQMVSSSSGASMVSAFLQLPAGLSSPSIASTALPTSKHSSWNSSPFSIASSTNLHITATATPPTASSQGTFPFGGHASIRAAPKFPLAPVLTTAPFSAPTPLPQAASPHALPPANNSRTFQLHPVPRGSSLTGSPPPSLSALSPSSGESRKDEETPSNPSSPTLVNPIVSRAFGLATKTRSGSRSGTISGRVGSSGSDGRSNQANTLFSSAFSSMIANAIASLSQPTTTLSAFATTSATTTTSSVATVAATTSAAVPVSPSLASTSTTFVVPNLVVSTVASATTSSLTALESPTITTSFPTATTSSLVTASSLIASYISPTTTTPTFMSTASTTTISITTNIPSAARALGTACPPLNLASPVLTPSPLNSPSPTTSLTTISAATPLDGLYPTLLHHPPTPSSPAESSSQTNTTTTSPQQQPQQRHLSPVADQAQAESDAAAISQQMAHQHAIQHELVPKARLLEKEGQRDERLRWVQEQHAGADVINVARRLSTDIIANTNREGRRNQHLTDYRIQSTGVTGRSSAGRSLVELSNLHQRVHAIAVAGMMGSPSDSATSSTVAIQVPPSQAPPPTQSPQPSSPQSPSPSTLTPATTVSPTVSPSVSPRPPRTPFIDITASFTNSSILSQHPHIPPQPLQRPLPPVTSRQPAIPSQRQSSLVIWEQGQEGGSTRGRGSTPHRRSPGSSRRPPTSLSTSLTESSAISSPRASQRPTPQGLVRSSPRSSPQGSTKSLPQSSGRSSPQSQSERRSRVCPSAHHTGLEESGPKESNIENRPVAEGSISSFPPSVNPTWSPSPVADVPISRPFSPSGEVSDEDTTLVPSSNQLSQQLTCSSPEHQDHEVIDSDSKEYYSASSQQGSVTEDDDAQITQSPLDADDGSAATAPASLLGPGPSDDMGGDDILAGEAVAARLTTGTAPVTDAGPIAGETVEISRGRLPTRRSVRIQARTQSAVTPYGRLEPINTLRRSERIHQRNLRTATVPVEPAAVPRPTLVSRARQVSTPTATAAADAPEVPEVRRSARIQQARELNIRRNCKHRVVKKSTVEKTKSNKKASKKKK